MRIIKRFTMDTNLNELMSRHERKKITRTAIKILERRIELLEKASDDLWDETMRLDSKRKELIKYKDSGYKGELPRLMAPKCDVKDK